MRPIIKYVEVSDGDKEWWNRKRTARKMIERSGHIVKDVWYHGRNPKTGHPVFAVEVKV